MPDVDVASMLNAALMKKWVKNGQLARWKLPPSHEFDFSKVGLVLLSMDYPTNINQSLVTVPLILGKDSYVNKAKTTIKHAFRYERQTEEKAEWHVTGGLKLTAGAKFEAGVPLLGAATVSLSVEMSVEGGTAGSQTKTVTRSDEIEVTVAPESSAYVTALLSVGTLSNVPFTARMKAIGQVGALISGSSGEGTYPQDFNTMWADLETGVGWYQYGSWAPIVGPPLEDKDREFQVTGTFNGTYGINVVVNTSPNDQQPALDAMNARAEL